MRWYERKLEVVVETDKMKLLWDFNIQCDHIIEHRRPDILLVEKVEEACMINDLADIDRL